MLCTRCNTALGAFGDDPNTLKRAIAYLESEMDIEVELDDCDEDCPWMLEHLGLTVTPTVTEARNEWGEVATTREM